MENTEIYRRYTGSMKKIYGRYTRDTGDIQKYTGDTHGIYARNATIYRRYSRDIHEINEDIPGIYIRYMYICVEYIRVKYEVYKVIREIHETFDRVIRDIYIYGR